MNTSGNRWQPLAMEKLSAIRDNFNDIFPESEYGDLAEKISVYWIKRLQAAWEGKPDRIRDKDLRCDPSDPLSRIEQHAMVIAYADSVHQDDEQTLAVLDRFFQTHFPAVRGIHMLPACTIVEDRFNDGYFSQVERNRIHPRFGTNDLFGRTMEKYFSMADFVLNHVDIGNPAFQAYLAGDDAAGKCFYVFSEPEYRRMKVAGDFEQIFRPRPFPLFTIFRRRPVDPVYAGMSPAERFQALNRNLAPDAIPDAVIGIMSVFDKIQNDQMLFEDDYANVTAFRQYLAQTLNINPDALFRLSEIQETKHPPYVFTDGIRTRAGLLMATGMDAATAERINALYEQSDPVIFGEPFRAMTTFSHVQVDVNTSTYEGLKMLADDFSWYLGLDLNLLRLDAANYAFKKWKTSCFGLPEVTRLMRILYLSMDAVSPRMVPNLEVNDTLDTVLSQMADKSAPPPMMYDFHLASILPAVFNTGNTKILDRIFERIAAYDLPKRSIRFSVAESHDGKSVRGSVGILTISERQELADIVSKNGGKIKYKAVPAGRITEGEFKSICLEAGLDRITAAERLFGPRQTNGDILHLKDEFRSIDEILAALGKRDAASPALTFFAEKVINGREPYELCVSTRDSLTRIGDPQLEAARYLSFYTLAFALMGRNVKSIYFNELVGLGNDYDRMRQSGELRDIKRTRSEYRALSEKISNNETIHLYIARGIDQLIATVDSDPALAPYGNEAETLPSGNPAVALIHNRCGRYHSVVAVNLSAKPETAVINFHRSGFEGSDPIVNRLNGAPCPGNPDGRLEIELEPFGRLYLAAKNHEDLNHVGM